MSRTAQERRNRRGSRRRDRNRQPLFSIPFRRLHNTFASLEVISEEQIEQIHEASMRILEDIGLRWLDDEALDLWEQAGARVDRSAQHAWLDRNLVMELVGKAPYSFTWRARNPERNITIGGDSIPFFPHSGMVYVSDLDAGRRPGTMCDYQNLLKLQHMCNVLHAATEQLVEPQDIEPSFRHLRRKQAGYTLTDKAVTAAMLGRVVCRDTLEISKLVFDGDLITGGPVTGGVVNVNSPLVYDKRMLGGLITMARAGQIVIVTPFVLAGAMSPVTLAAAAAQQNAEALAGIALTQVVRPGAPAVYGAFLTNVDMKSGSPAFGTPEGALAIAMGAQMARRYGLPHRGNGALTSANAVDVQSTYESAWTLWPSVLSHTNIVYHAAGWMESGLTVSFEKLVIDAENLAMMQRFLQGVGIDDDTLALASIAEVGPSGHHFGTAHTQARYETAFHASSLADYRNHDTWLDDGEQTTVERARQVWQDMLRQYEAPPLDISICEAMEDYVARREQELVGVNLFADE